MKCNSIVDLQDLTLTSEVKPQNANIPDEEYQQIWSSVGGRTIKEWVQLPDKNKQIYDKYKCLDIDYLTYKKIYIRIFTLAFRGLPNLNRIEILLISVLFLCKLHVKPI